MRGGRHPAVGRRQRLPLAGRSARRARERVAHGVLGYTTAAASAARGDRRAPRAAPRLARRSGMDRFPSGRGPRPSRQRSRELLQPDGTCWSRRRSITTSSVPWSLRHGRTREVPLVLERGPLDVGPRRVRSARTPRTRSLFLCNPQNPGGTVFPRLELRAARRGGGRRRSSCPTRSIATWSSTRRRATCRSRACRRTSRDAR